MAWPERVIDTWEDLQMVGDLAIKGGAFTDVYAFRGQAVAAYSLMPSLLRHVTRGGLRAPQALELETLALREFQAQAHLHVQLAVLPPKNDIFAWWALMQHHRAPTRMLDWSASFYVGLYFAVEDSSDNDGAVWYFNIEQVSASMRVLHSGPDSTEPGEFQQLFLEAAAPARVVLRKPSHRSDRMVAQQGGFSLSSQILADHASAIEHAIVSVPNESPDPLFGRIVIPKSRKPEFLRRLRSMNITAASLFPGVDGLGKAIEQDVRMRSSASAETLTMLRS